MLATGGTGWKRPSSILSLNSLSIFQRKNIVDSLMVGVSSGLSPTRWTLLPGIGRSFRTGFAGFSLVSHPLLW